MIPSEIKKKRTESILKELIPEALSSLDDGLINGLYVTEVRCHKGRYDADVYIDKTIFSQDEMNTILNKLEKVKRYIQNYCASKEGWFKSPKLTFYFDNLLEKQNHLDDLFKKVEEELKKNKDD